MSNSMDWMDDKDPNAKSHLDRAKSKKRVPTLFMFPAKSNSTFIRYFRLATAELSKDEKTLVIIEDLRLWEIKGKNLGELWRAIGDETQDEIREGETYGKAVVNSMNIIKGEFQK